MRDTVDQHSTGGPDPSGDSGKNSKGKPTQIPRLGFTPSVMLIKMFPFSAVKVYGQVQLVMTGQDGSWAEPSSQKAFAKVNESACLSQEFAQLGGRYLLDGLTQWHNMQ